MATATEEIWISNEEGQKKLEGAELEAFLADRAAVHVEIEKQKAESQSKANARAALLDRLGITPEEAKLLLL